jgi:hypothetical protein
MLDVGIYTWRTPFERFYLKSAYYIQSLRLKKRLEFCKKKSPTAGLDVGLFFEPTCSMISCNQT